MSLPLIYISIIISIFCKNSGKFFLLVPFLISHIQISLHEIPILFFYLQICFYQYPDYPYNLQGIIFFKIVKFYYIFYFYFKNKLHIKTNLKNIITFLLFYFLFYYFNTIQSNFEIRQKNNKIYNKIIINITNHSKIY